jgi:hypothetical protein
MVVIVGGAAGLGYFIWLLWEYFDSHDEDDVRLSFQDFQRIYSLAPNKWERSDYSFSRREWNRKNGFNCVYIETRISMKSFIDFIKLFSWVKQKEKKEKKEERDRGRYKNLKNLKILVERDHDDICKKLKEEEQKAFQLRQEIIDRLGDSK